MWKKSPRTISYIIEKLQSFYTNHSNKEAMDWNLFISFGNIYNDKIYDLIDPKNTKNIHLKKNKKTNEYYLKNLTQIKIKKISSFLKNMHSAYENRKYHLHNNHHKKHQKRRRSSKAKKPTTTNINNEDIFSRCHMFALIKLNVYTINGIDSKGNKQKTKISSTILNFIDCASYPQINYAPISDVDKTDYHHLNYSFIQLNALMTRIAKKNDLSIDNRESMLTKLLYPIRQNHRYLAHDAVPHSPLSAQSAQSMEPSNNNIDDYGKLLIMINCTLKPSLRPETMATLRFGNLPTVDPFILSMMEKQRHKIKKYETKIKELKTKIKIQKKELKTSLRSNGNGNSNHNQNGSNDAHYRQLIKKSNEEIKQLKFKMDQLNQLVARLRAENEDLINTNSLNDNNAMDIQNRYDKLNSNYELIKLDFAAVKKEIDTQKNHNFWLMEDYNQLKIKYDKLISAANQSPTLTATKRRHSKSGKTEEIGDLLKQIGTLKEEGMENDMLLQKADNKCKEYETQIDELEDELQSIQQTHKQQLNELMTGIKERDDQINELRKELNTKDDQTAKHHQSMRDDTEIYVKYIKDLENVLKRNGINYHKNTSDKLMNHNNGHNHDNVEDEQTEDPQFVIRKLKMEIIKYKTDINSSPVVRKLRDTKHKLEEKVINLRTDKAKQLVSFNQEKYKFEQQINKLQTQLKTVNAIRKWMKLIHKRELLTVSQNIERANRKMKENYSQNNEFREQMHVLRKIAEQKFTHALKHKMNKNKQVNGHYNTPSPSYRQNNNNNHEINGVNIIAPNQINGIPSMMTLEPYKSITSTVGRDFNDMDYEQLAIESSADFEQQMVGLLPENLKRIHQVIDRLTNKLMIKNGQLHELRGKFEKLTRKSKLLEYNLTLYNRSHANSNSNSSANKRQRTDSTYSTIPSTPAIPFNHSSQALEDEEDDNDDVDGDGDDHDQNGNQNASQQNHGYRQRKETNHKSTESNHVVTNSSFDEYLPNILDKLNIHQLQPTNHHTDNHEDDEDNHGNQETFMIHYENIYDDDELIIDNVPDCDKPEKGRDDTDTKEEEHYLKSFTKTRSFSAADEHTPAFRTANVKQYTLRARGSVNTSLNLNNNKSRISVSNEKSGSPEYDLWDKEYQNDECNKQKQKQIRLLQQSLSIAFHIDNRKNTRIKLNVSMTPRDVYQRMCNGLIKDENKNKKFTLIIQHNISPDFEKIIVPFENTNMSFWELIVEFGILNLLHFNICCDEDLEKYFDVTNNDDLKGYNPKIKVKKKKKDNKEGPGSRSGSRRGSIIWNMFNKK